VHLYLCLNHPELAQQAPAAHGVARHADGPAPGTLDPQGRPGSGSAQHPSCLLLLPWGDGGEPLVLNPSRCSRRDVAVVAAARRGDSDLDPPLSGAMGRLLGYACRYDLSPDGRAWRARGLVQLHVHLMRDGVELPPVWLGAFGCGLSVGRQAFDRIVARTRQRWQLAANRALAGTRCTTPDGRTWVVTRFTVTASPADSPADTPPGNPAAGLVSTAR
jgi:hypothetical protein